MYVPKSTKEQARLAAFETARLVETLLLDAAEKELAWVAEFVGPAEAATVTIKTFKPLKPEEGLVP